ncbi:MAG TPA: sigma-70 family RNA polymerase sigma factor [Candidatus Saccharimonadales bacterium]|nr:sigma-70 family RNA polymerase sigma factor [Candidatus Saccharimonadales bacterium]
MRRAPGGVRRMFLDAVLGSTPWARAMRRCSPPEEQTVTNLLANLHFLNGGNSEADSAVLRECITGGSLDALVQRFGYDWHHPGTANRLALATGKVVRNVLPVVANLRSGKHGPTMDGLIARLHGRAEELLDTAVYPDQPQHSAARALAIRAVGPDDTQAVHRFVAHTSAWYNGLLTYMPSPKLEKVLEELRPLYEHIGEDASAGEWMLSEAVGSPEAGRSPKTFHDIEAEVSVGPEQAAAFVHELQCAAERLDELRRRVTVTTLGGTATKRQVRRNKPKGEAPFDSQFDDLPADPIKSQGEPDEQDIADLEEEIAAPQPDLDEPTGPIDTWELYMKEVGKVSLLSSDQVVELCKRMEAGWYAEELLLQLEDNPALLNDRPFTEAELKYLFEDALAAKDELTTANLRLVISIAKRYIRGRESMDIKDLNTEGFFGLNQAALKFDYTKGYRFATYATWWIRQAVTRGIADYDRTIRLPVHKVEILNRFKRVRDALRIELIEEPSLEQIAKRMKVEIAVVEEALKDLETTATIALETKVGADKSDELEKFIGDTRAPDPLGEVIASAEASELSDLLAQLTPEEARAFSASVFGGRGVREIGALMGIKWKEAEAHIESAKWKLRLIVNGEPVPTPEELAAERDKQARDALLETMPEEFADGFRAIREKDPEGFERLLGMAFETVSHSMAMAIRARFGVQTKEGDRHDQFNLARIKAGIALMASNTALILADRAAEITFGKSVARAQTPTTFWIDVGLPVPIDVAPEERRNAAAELIGRSSLEERMREAIIRAYGLDGYAPESVEALSTRLGFKKNLYGRMRNAFVQLREAYNDQ